MPLPDWFWEQSALEPSPTPPPTPSPSPEDLTLIRRRRLYVNRGARVRVSWLVDQHQRLLESNRYALVVCWGSPGDILPRWFQVNKGLRSQLNAASGMGWNAAEHDVTLDRSKDGLWRIECHPDSLLVGASPALKNNLCTQIEDLILGWAPHLLSKLNRKPLV